MQRSIRSNSIAPQRRAVIVSLRGTSNSRSIDSGCHSCSVHGIGTLIAASTACLSSRAVKRRGSSRLLVWVPFLSQNGGRSPAAARDIPEFWARTRGVSLCGCSPRTRQSRRAPMAAWMNKQGKIQGQSTLRSVVATGRGASIFVAVPNCSSSWKCTGERQ